jgi:hypothetical protein
MLEEKPTPVIRDLPYLRKLKNTPGILGRCLGWVLDDLPESDGREGQDCHKDGHDCP